MSTTPLPHRRLTALELINEDRFRQLHNQLLNFYFSIRAVLPVIPEFNFTIPHESAYDDVKDKWMLAGHGPRFVGKYHLARTDDERQALLDSLPKVPHDSNTTFWHKLEVLTAEYRWELKPEFDGRFESVEFSKWLSNLLSRTDLPVLKSTNCCDAFLQHFLGREIPADDKVVVKDEIIEFFYIQQSAVSLEQTPVVVVSIGVPEMSGYAFVVINQETHSGGAFADSKRAHPRFELSLLWNEHELCWNKTDVIGVHCDFLEQVSRRFLEYVGMPYYEEVSLKEKEEIYQQLVDHILNHRETWFKDIFDYNSQVKRRKIQLPNVLCLVIENSNSYSWGSSFRISPLKDFEEVEVSFPAAYRFEGRGTAPEAWYSVNSHNFRHGGPPISPYRERMLIDLIKQFIAAPVDMLQIETALRSDDEDSI
jgi:hypothetical protein